MLTEIFTILCTLTRRHVLKMLLFLLSFPSILIAKRIADAISMDIVRGVVDTKMVGWEVVEKTVLRKTTVRYYPAIRLAPDSDEARLLLEKKQQSSSSKIKDGLIVKYLGVDWGCSRIYDYIPASRWKPSNIGGGGGGGEGGDDDDAMRIQTTVVAKRKSRGKKTCTKHPLDDEGRLANFLNHIKRKSRFKNEPIDLKVEELVIRRTWQVVVQQQREFEMAKIQEEKERAARQVLAPMVVVLSHDEAVTASADHDDNDNDDDRIVERGMVKSFSLNEETTIPTLRIGDEIEFYAPEGIAGSPMWLRRAKIMGIRRDHEYPLVFTELIHLLPKTHRIRKLPNGCYRPIETYDLVDQGNINVAISLNQSIATLKRTRDDVYKAANDYWNNGQAENTNVNHPPVMKRGRLDQKNNNNNNNGGACVGRSKRTKKTQDDVNKGNDQSENTSVNPQVMKRGKRDQKNNNNGGASVGRSKRIQTTQDDVNKANGQSENTNVNPQVMKRGQQDQHNNIDGRRNKRIQTTQDYVNKANDQSEYTNVNPQVM
jgi:hypothetical protein